MLRTEVSNFEKEAEPPPPEEDVKEEDPRVAQKGQKAWEGGETRKLPQYHAHGN